MDVAKGIDMESGQVAYFGTGSKDLSTGSGLKIFSNSGNVFLKASAGTNAALTPSLNAKVVIESGLRG